jgi:membrane protease YdiL (CAAX protease family)
LASPENPQFNPQRPANDPGSNQPDAFLTSSIEPTGIPSPPRPAPIENPVWNGWDVLLIVGVSIATILVFQFALLLGAHFFFYPRTPLVDLAQQPMLLLVSQFLIDGAVVIYLLLLVEGKYNVGFGRAIKWNWPRAVWRPLGIGVIMLLVLSMLENLLPMPKDTPFEKLFSSPRDAYLLAIIAVTIGPLVEELFFRGLFYPVVARRWGAVWGVGLTALPFALMHMPQYGYAWGALLVIFIVGVVCGTVRAVTRSVGASFLVHVGYNGAQMLIALAWTRGFTRMPKALVELALR